MGDPIRLAVLTPSLTGQVHIEHGEAIADLRVQCLRRGIAFRRFYNVEHNLCLADIMEAMNGDDHAGDACGAGAEAPASV